MEWFILAAFVIIIALYEKWARVQVSKLNNSEHEIDYMGRRIVKDSIE
jgi:hypothetical protein